MNSNSILQAISNYLNHTNCRIEPLQNNKLQITIDENTSIVLTILETSVYLFIIDNKNVLPMVLSLQDPHLLYNIIKIIDTLKN